MNPPTAPSPNPALTSPVRLILRMAPACLSEVLPGDCAISLASYPHAREWAPAKGKGRAVFR
ncbi:hypothetical protein GCM10010216_25870 [Streptomyces flaveolus]|nr:hypothetical protein GCM10010216_25870 [Streptomyces flaveolus]